MEIISLLLTKEVLQVLGPILAIGGTAFYIYFKGKRSGAEEVVKDYTKSNEEYKGDIKKAEQQNMDLEKEKNGKISQILNASSKLSSLIELFNKNSRGGKAARRKTRKK